MQEKSRHVRSQIIDSDGRDDHGLALRFHVPYVPDRTVKPGGSVLRERTLQAAMEAYIDDTEASRFCMGRRVHSSFLPPETAVRLAWAGQFTAIPHLIPNLTENRSQAVKAVRLDKARLTLTKSVQLQSAHPKELAIHPGENPSEYMTCEPLDARSCNDAIVISQ
jgi:hypothetical protein